MSKELFKRKHLTEEERAKVYGKSEKPTKSKQEREERFKETIKGMHERAREAAREQGIPEIDDSVYEQIDCSPEPCDDRE